MVMVDPDDEAAARAWAAFMGGRLDEATAICHEALARSPDHAGLLGICGIVIGECGDIEAAVEKLQLARSRAPNNPDWQFNLGIAYLRAGRLLEAKAALLEALRLQPNSVGCLVELAKLHAMLSEDRDILIVCQNVLAHDPGNVDGHLLLAETLLRRGEMALGWKAYVKGQRLRRDRARIEASPAAEPVTADAPWKPGRSQDQSVLLTGDQGFAETIQFSRYVPLVAQQCASVALQSPIELVPLLSRIPGITVIPAGQSQLAYAAHAMLSDLPELFATTTGNIPCATPYLDADPVRVEVWRERLAAFLGNKRVLVGLTWSGGIPSQRRAQEPLWFAQMAPLLAIPDIAFLGLQKPAQPGDVDATRGAHFLDLSAHLADFGEIAAVLANVDLAITVDGPVAHLAGALGRAVWVLLPRPADWRWFKDRDDSPWYPTMRLFRQRAIGAWEEPLTQAAASLREFVGKSDQIMTPRGSS
jgi:tetratricopeptide (TPR) repeat protein